MPTALSAFRTTIQKRVGNRQGVDDPAIIDNAINTAHKLISRIHDFDELLVVDTTSADTVASQKTYHLINDWGLTRPKSIYSLRYIDGADSRIITYQPKSKFDQEHPYPEGDAEGRPSIYIQFGLNVELYTIPNAAKDVYVRYSQWPVVLSGDANETPYLYIDDIIEGLGTALTWFAYEEMDNAVVWLKMAQLNMSSVLADLGQKPNRMWSMAKPRKGSDGGSPVDQYWLNAFVKEV